MKICADETLDQIKEAERRLTVRAHDFDNLARTCHPAESAHYVHIAVQYRSSAAACRAEIARREAVR